jgi:hypothetical protein
MLSEPQNRYYEINLYAFSAMLNLPQTLAFI